MDEFRGRGWMPLQPRLLDYESAQVLLIGEEVGDISKALEPARKDEKEHKETPMEEMEKLEHEDEIRVNHLKGTVLYPFDERLAVQLLIFLDHFKGMIQSSRTLV